MLFDLVAPCLKVSQTEMTTYCTAAVNETSVVFRMCENYSMFLFTFVLYLLFTLLRC